MGRESGALQVAAVDQGVSGNVAQLEVGWLKVLPALGRGGVMLRCGLRKMCRVTSHLPAQSSI